MTTFSIMLARSALVASIAGTLGCELATNVDRGLIPADGGTSTSTGTGTTTTGTGGTGGTGGMGGADGGTVCKVASDCPGVENECQKRTCTSGQCGTAYQPEGTALMVQQAGTCQKNVCDGSGGTKLIPDDSNLPVDGNHCTNDVCTNGVASNPPFPAGTACNDQGGKVCDGAAHCVACVQGSDCATGHCVQNTCVTGDCIDGVQDGNETDVDCGGSAACALCADGKKCNGGTDCQSGVCTAGVCAASTCTDGVKNGAETDVDCGGGTCPACGPGKACTGNTDCKGGACAGGTCQASCTDGVKDGTETDVDCGGTCGPCAVGKSCGVNADCTNDACDAVTKKCAGDQCSDHQKDGTETDVDCGGTMCSKCVVGKQCGGNGDCASALCVGGTCAAGPTCSDGVKDGAETDVDCGGTCPTCAVGKACNVNADCTSNACNVLTKKCVSGPCADGQKDGAETDVDCGGGTCATCGNGKACLVDSDCTSNGCNGITLTCSSVNPCSDNHKDGLETDIDCGGPLCSKCAIGKGCLVNADCASNVCSASKLCVGSPCVDGQKDGAETDVDCGGGTCPKCADLKACSGPADCQSGVCTGGVCQHPTCTDGVQNQNETSVDCGGACGTCTVLILGAGVSSTLGGELHPGGAWTTSTTLGGMSVDGLSLGFLGGGGSAVGLMRFTKLGDPADNHLQWTTWTPGAWTAFADVGAGITTPNAPAVGAQGATALGAFRGFDDQYYYATFTGGAWSGALPVQPTAGGQSSGPQGPSFDGATGSLAFGGDNQHLFVQSWSGSAWGSAQDLDGTDLTSLSPTIAGIAPSGSAAMLVYVRASDGQIFYVTLSGGTWSSPDVIPGAFTNDPVALAPVRTGGAVLAWRGQDGNLYFSRFLGGVWSTAPFSTPNVSVVSAPALARGVGSAIAEIAFIESDSVAYHARLVGGAWTTPTAVGGSGLGHVAIASSP